MSSTPMVMTVIRGFIESPRQVVNETRRRLAPGAEVGPGLAEGGPQRALRQVDDVDPAQGPEVGARNVAQAVAERVGAPGVEVGADRLAGHTARARGDQHLEACYDGRQR